MQLNTVQNNEFAKQINELDALAKTHATKAVDYARQAGAMLLKVKGELPHGQWVAWVEENLTMSIRQVQRYIAVSQGKPVPVRHLAGRACQIFCVNGVGACQIFCVNGVEGHC